MTVMLFYVIGIPLVAFLLLRRNKDHLDEIAVKQRFGFLCEGYRKEAYFWELVVLSRKVILSGIAVFFTTSAQVQSLTVLTLCITCLVAQTAYRPFANAEVDRVEFLSLVNSVFTFLCGQYLFAVDGASEASQYGITFLMLASNVLFFGSGIRVVSKRMSSQLKLKMFQKSSRVHPELALLKETARTLPTVEAEPADNLPQGCAGAPINIKKLEQSTAESDSPLLSAQPVQERRLPDSLQIGPFSTGPSSAHQAGGT
jgi:hypothetical protein